MQTFLLGSLIIEVVVHKFLYLHSSDLNIKSLCKPYREAVNKGTLDLRSGRVKFGNECRQLMTH